MNLQQIREEVKQAGFSPEGVTIINNLLAKAEKRGYLEKEEKDELNGIIDIEIEGAKIIADAKKETAAALNDFADGVEDDLDKAIADLETIGQAVVPPKPPRPVES